MKKSWDLGPSPSVTVDVFEGTIQVYPSPDHLVSAEITTVAQCKYSQSDSDVALGTIDLELNVRGDSIRISVKASSGTGFRKEADVDLYVPQGVHLDVRTGAGRSGSAAATRGMFRFTSPSQRRRFAPVTIRGID